MSRKAIVCALVLVFAVAASALRAQQDKSKRPSPPATAKCELAGGKTVTIDYSSPRKKGRNVFPDVVKYGEVWRTGANEATTFVTTGDIMHPSTQLQMCVNKLADTSRKAPHCTIVKATLALVVSHSIASFPPLSLMVNYRVEDLHALVKVLREEGCNVLEKVDDSEFGKFAWVIDPEGNKVELWQPPAGQ